MRKYVRGLALGIFICYVCFLQIECAAIVLTGGNIEFCRLKLRKEDKPSTSMRFPDRQFLMAECRSAINICCLGI